jgi:hypothetical protein
MPVELPDDLRLSSVRCIESFLAPPVHSTGCSTGMGALYTAAIDELAAPQSWSSGSSWGHDVADSALSIDAGQERYSEMRIEMAAPRRARHRGQCSRVRNGARRRTLSPHLGQCIYDIDLLKQGCPTVLRLRHSESGITSGTRSASARLQARVIATQARNHAAFEVRPGRARARCTRVLSRCAAPGRFRCLLADVGVRTGEAEWRRICSAAT